MPWHIVMILVCMDRGDPNQYYGSKQPRFMIVSILIDYRRQPTLLIDVLNQYLDYRRHPYVLLDVLG